jgi:hypothetical protein
MMWNRLLIITKEKQTGLAKRFAAQLQLTLNAIKRNPFFTTIRYDEIAVVALKNFLTWYAHRRRYSTRKGPFW